MKTKEIKEKFETAWEMLDKLFALVIVGVIIGSIVAVIWMAHENAVLNQVTTTVCIYPDTCQYQVPAGGSGAQNQFNAAYQALYNAGGGTLYILAGTYK